MKFLLIPDAFKESLPSVKVAEAIQEGIKKVLQTSSFQYIAVSDGGEGFLNTIAQYINCTKVAISVKNPLGKRLESFYLYDESKKTAYVELANASGLELLVPEERNPLVTSTYGTGLQIKNAIENGAKSIYIGLGGSATNDGGMGIAHALGYNFLDKNGRLLKPIGGNLEAVDSIRKPKIDVVSKIDFFALNDVANPLYGAQGATHVYAEQKGADKNAIAQLERGLRNLDRVVTQTFGKSMATLSGAGAAGGTAYGLRSFMNATYISGIDFTIQLSGVDQLLSKEQYDYIITGEGKLDNQTANGKLINGVLGLGKKHNLPVLAVCGKCDMEMRNAKSMGLSDVIEIQDPKRSLEYNLKNASELIVKDIEKYIVSNDFH